MTNGLALCFLSLVPAPNREWLYTYLVSIRHGTGGTFEIMFSKSPGNAFDFFVR